MTGGWTLEEAYESQDLARTLAPKLARDVQRKDETFRQLKVIMGRPVFTVGELNKMVMDALAAIEAELKEIE